MTNFELCAEGQDYFFDFVSHHSIKILAKTLHELNVFSENNSLVIGVSFKTSHLPKGILRYRNISKDIRGWYHEIVVSNFEKARDIEVQFEWDSSFITELKFCFWRTDKAQTNTAIHIESEYEPPKQERGMEIINSDTPKSVTSAFSLLLESGDSVSGDYLEFGVYQGHSLYTAISSAQKHGLDSMRFFGFDSFQGLPEPDEADANTTNEDAEFWGQGMYACSKEDVLRKLNDSGVDMTKVNLVEGFFQDSLKPELIESFTIERAAVILIDSDLYQSAKSALEFAAPLIQEGTLIIFDEWNIHEDDEKGEKKAFSEFLNENKWMKAKKLDSLGYSVTFRMSLNKP